MNKYQSQINKAKSIKALQKVANSLDVKIGNMKNIDNNENNTDYMNIQKTEDIENSSSIVLPVSVGLLSRGA